MGHVDRRQMLAGSFGMSLAWLFPGRGAFAAAQLPTEGAPGEAAIEKAFQVFFASPYFLEAREAAVASGQLMQNKAVVIYGQTVTLQGAYVTAGFPLGIVARELVIAEGTVIDTSGIQGQPHYLQGNRATDGRAYGESGKGGDGGGQGNDAGPLVILCDRLTGKLDLRGVGGNGGDGQQGGNGLIGGRGQDGRPRPKCEDGSRGGTGGSGGAGGAGGVGGVGARMLVTSRQPLSAEQVSFALTGGAAGKGGAHGTAAEGGEGGNGTRKWEDRDRPGKNN